MLIGDVERQVLETIAGHRGRLPAARAGGKPHPADAQLAARWAPDFAAAGLDAAAIEAAVRRRLAAVAGMEKAVLCAIAARPAHDRTDEEDVQLAARLALDYVAAGVPVGEVAGLVVRWFETVIDIHVTLLEAHRAAAAVPHPDAVRKQSARWAEELAGYPADAIPGLVGGRLRDPKHARDLWLVSNGMRLKEEVADGMRKAAGGIVLV